MLKFNSFVLYYSTHIMIKIKRLIPNLLTAGNLIGGILAIIFAITGKLEWSPYCIFISAIFDFLDGFVARILKVQSELGKQLDSLADMVTFGVAPGVIVMVMLSSWNSTLNQYDFLSFESNTELMGIGLIIPVFALFRLAKFNLDTRQTSSFIGLPTPAMTLFFAAIPILVISGSQSLIGWQVNLASIFTNSTFLIISTLIMSIMMVVELPLFALKFNGFKWNKNKLRYIFLTISLGLFATLLFWSIPIIIILYLFLSIINNLIHKRNEI
jgi:CDP-diacylglycerol--serine O-phosphatidyltransferase